MFQIHARSLVFHRCFPHPPRENLSIHEDFISEECLGLRNLSDLELSPLLTLSYVDGLCDCKLQVTRVFGNKSQKIYLALVYCWSPSSNRFFFQTIQMLITVLNVATVVALPPYGKEAHEIEISRCSYWLGRRNRR